MGQPKSRSITMTVQRRAELVLLVLAASAWLACARDAVPSPASELDTGASVDGRIDASLAVRVDAEADVTPTQADSDASAVEVTVPPSGELDGGVPTDGGRVSLVVHELWTRLDPADDPFDDRPQAVDCTWGATMAETLSDERAFSVDTGFCNYLTVTQPTLWPVAAGSTIKVRLWHFELTAPAPAQAHTALLVDGLSVMDEQVAIPGPGALIVRELRVPRDIPEGAPVQFHLHNHGTNSWALVEVSTGP